MSPSKFEAQATASPTKLSVPNRKIRNQPTNRVHDIEFAAEISTSLIAQVRNLQALLAEKEDELKEVRVEKSRLEYEAENFQQRVKALDENEHRYKDENWNLETQLHELITAQKDAADREKKLTQCLNLLQAEKNATQQKLDEVRLSHSRLVEEHTAAVKRHDIELGTAKRNIILADSERGAMQRKIEELTLQNQELAKAFSIQRGRTAEREQVARLSDEDFETANDNLTPEASPPPSPIKGTPRHSMLETETLKTSLGHAQRTIQNLRTNYHREKTEKLELRRMLHEARDEVEKLRNEPVVSNKRIRKAEPKEPKKELRKAPRLLGGLRNTRSEIFTDDSNWEDQPDTASSTRPSPESQSSAKFVTPAGSDDGNNSDRFETANDASDAAFETAHEPGTETDDFQTGVEEFSSDDDTETETESPSKRNTLRLRQHNLPMGLGRSRSIDSTASTEDDDDDYPFEHHGMRTPPLLPLQARFPLRVSRGAFRRSRQASEEPALQSSPSSFVNHSVMSTPKQQVQSLAAELGDFEGSDNDSTLSGTPSRRSIRGRTTTPPPAVPRLPRFLMVDNGMMTDPLPETNVPAAEVAVIRAEHAEQMRQLTVDHVNSQAASLEALEARHAAEISRAEATVKEALIHEIETLKLSHSDELSKAAADAMASRREEVGALKAVHSKEIDALKIAHSEQLALREAEIKATHAAAIEALTAKHFEEIATLKKDSDASHAAELEALQAKHFNELSALRKDLDVAHATEMEAVKATHSEELSNAKTDSDTAHIAEVAALAAAHATQIEQAKNELVEVHAQELEALRASHADHVEQSKSKLVEAHAKELGSLKSIHAVEIEQAKQDSEIVHAAQIDALKKAHLREIDEVKDIINSKHSHELQVLKETQAEQFEKLKKESEAAHAAEIAALSALHSKKLASSKAESEATLSRELSAIKDTHAREIDSLKSHYAAAQAKELEGFKNALAKQVESSKVEGNAAHAQQLEALNAAHIEIVEAHKRESEASQAQALSLLRVNHEKQIEELRNELVAAKFAELESLAVSHSKELDSLRTEAESSRAKLLEDLASAHSLELEKLRSESESAKVNELAALHASHAVALDALKTKHESTLSKELESLQKQHAAVLANQLGALRAEKDAAHSQELEQLKQEYAMVLARDLAALREELDDTRLGELQALKDEHEAVLTSKLEALKANHTKVLTKELKALEDKHQATLVRELQALATDRDATQANEIEKLHTAHAVSLDALRDEHQATLHNTTNMLKDNHARELDALSRLHDTNQVEAIETLKAGHAAQLDEIRRDHETVLVRQLDAATAHHKAMLDAQKQESSAEKDRLLASHASALQSLRKSQAIIPPALVVSPISTVETEPVEMTDDRSPSRKAFIIPRETERPHTPQSTTTKLFGKSKASATDALFIAEDETRQSPSVPKGPETPDSQRPFKEISTNTDMAQSRRNAATATIDHSSQTTLTAESLERMLKHRRQLSQDSITIVTARGEVTVTPYGDAVSPSAVLSDAASAGTIRVRRSQESIGSIARAKHRMADSGALSTPEPVPTRRPGSSASVRTPAPSRPPLPANHREAIEAARTGSSGGGKGTMGPPLLPASAYRNSGSRPWTPGSNPPLSPSSVRNTPTPRAGRSGLHSPTRMPVQSSQSSVSSFASEVDTRFNMRSDMGMDAGGFGHNTDPRMIQAITQTMIGEYLWKYTRKTGRGELSENRHRRYFWVHPYTRTLYWSDRDPSTAGRTELKAKSVQIEAVRVVTDDNPMPPGLHRKSLIIISPGRTIKFTCTTGQRHETWFNALSYLLLRTGDDHQPDAEDIAINITQDDVDEFNPSAHHRTQNANKSKAPPSLSSYNSRTTRNESPNIDVAMSIPTLSPTREKGSVRPSTLNRLSGYWKSGTISGTFGSLRSKGQTPNESAIYEASEVHDSAEDLRQIIEEQDREADRLENVRACCDGRHI